MDVLSCRRQRLPWVRRGSSAKCNLELFEEPVEGDDVGEANGGRVDVWHS